jgi:hypothetical protein
MVAKSHVQSGRLGGSLALPSSQGRASLLASRAFFDIRKTFLAIGLVVASCIIAMNCSAQTFPDVTNLPSLASPPDILTMMNGEKVITQQKWFDERRPELKALFQHYMYGTFPPPVAVQPTVTYIDSNFFSGKATLKLVTLELAARGSHHISLLMVIPNHRAKPAPVFLGQNFDGNHTLVTDTNVPMPDSWIIHRLPRGSETNTWALEQSIDRGYAVATYYAGDVEPDTSNAAGGVRQTTYIGGRSDDWGTITAWAWGLQRAVDYLVTDNDIDSQHIAVVGHSRMGKTALLAGAFDERVAMIIPLQAGCGGTAPSRGTVGESVEKINTVFPYWFDDVFKRFNKEPQRLPFDQDALIALCAPRPVLLGQAVEDTWANPAGAFDMLKSASVVYRFLGGKGLPAKKMPAAGKLVAGTLGYFIRPGKHSMTALDWSYFLDFADKQWGKPAKN